MKKNSNWKVVINTDNPKKHTISVINNKECFSEYPIIYPNGKVAFDHPERIPGYVKKEVYSIAEKVFKYNNKR